MKNDSTLANLILNNLEEAGQIKRKAYQRRLPENPNLDYYYILRESGNTEPVLIEYGFIDNKKDSEKLKNNIEKYAEAVVKSITEYLGYPYVSKDEVLESYIVKKGDTLYSISKQFNIPIDAIKRINNLKNDTLSIGQELVLIENNNSNNYKTYKVQKNDTLYSISNMFNVSINDLKRINNLENDILSINQELLIPINNEEEIIESKEYSIYTVKKGDSIWKISQIYNITPEKLISLNNLTNLNLQINDQLLVPRISIDEIPDNEYIVQKGDTLWSIAKKVKLDVEKLKQLNNLDNNLLTIGQILIIE